MGGPVDELVAALRHRWSVGTVLDQRRGPQVARAGPFEVSSGARTQIFAADGTKLRDEDEAELALLAGDLRPAVLRTPRTRDRSDLLVRYEEFFAEQFPDLAEAV